MRRVEDLGWHSDGPSFPRTDGRGIEFGAPDRVAQQGRDLRVGQAGSLTGEEEKLSGLGMTWAQVDEPTHPRTLRSRSVRGLDRGPGCPCVRGLAGPGVLAVRSSRLLDGRSTPRSG